MSLIVAAKARDAVYIAADIRATDEDGNYSDMITPKLIPLYNDDGDKMAAVGVVGSIALIHIVREYIGSVNYTNALSFFSYQFPKLLYEAMTDNLWLFNSEGEPSIKGAFLVAAKDDRPHIFVIQSDLAVYEPGNDFYALGNGEGEARGILSTLIGIMPAAAAIQETILRVSRFNSTVSPESIVEVIKCA